MSIGGVTHLLPEEPEARGLLSLMLHCGARRPARRDAGGAYVPLSQPDVRLWTPSMIDDAETALTIAARAKRPGRYQIEAAIQSVHARRAVTGHTDWEAIALLYEGLMRWARPSAPASRRRQPWRRSEAQRPVWPRSALCRRPRSRAINRTGRWPRHLLEREGRVEEALEAYMRAIGLSEDSAVRAFLARRTSERTRPTP